MNFLLTTLLLLQARTPHVNPSATPYPETVDAWNPWHFLYAAIGIVVVILVLGYFVGFRNPFKKNKAANPYVHKVE